MNCKNIIYSGHVILQMFKREITFDMIEFVINNGETINSYPDDNPYPSRLIFAFYENRPIHIVLAKDNGNCIVITAYEPDKLKWSKDFKTKIK